MRSINWNLLLMLGARQTDERKNPVGIGGEHPHSIECFHHGLAWGGGGGGGGWGGGGKGETGI